MRDSRRDDLETPADHWKHHLVQKPTRIPTRDDLRLNKGATAGSRRRWATIGRNVLLIGFFAGVCSLAWLALHESASVPEQTATTVRIDFDGDGSITSDWVREYFANEPKLPPIFDMKSRLEKVPQIREAEVRRAPDGSVVVRVKERRAVARISVLPPSGVTETRLVASDGVVYDGVNVGDLTFRNLPVLRDVSVRHDAARGLNVIDGFETVAAFLDHAREKYPTLYREWREVSLKDFGGQPDAPDSLIFVRPRLSAQSPDSAALVEILFSSSGYEQELKHLANVREWLKRKLAAADKTKFPWYRLDLSIVNASDPARSYDEPRLIPVAKRQP